MKKLLIALAAAVLAVAGVSAEAPKMYIDGGITFPVYGNLDLPTNTKSDTTSSVGTDVSFRAMFTDLIGAYANAGFFFPQEEKVEKENPSRTETSTTSDWDSWSAFNAFAGLAIMPVHGEKIGLTIAPGFGIVSETIEPKNISDKIKRTCFGLGANVGLDIYITKSFYLKPNIESVLYFAGTTDLPSVMKAEGYKSSTTYFTCKPAFAVGYRF